LIDLCTRPSQVVAVNKIKHLVEQLSLAAVALDAEKAAQGAEVMEKDAVAELQAMTEVAKNAGSASGDWAGEYGEAAAEAALVAKAKQQAKGGGGEGGGERAGANDTGPTHRAAEVSGGKTQEKRCDRV